MNHLRRSWSYSIGSIIYDQILIWFRLIWGTKRFPSSTSLTPAILKDDRVTQRKDRLQWNHLKIKWNHSIGNSIWSMIPASRMWVSIYTEKQVIQHFIKSGYRERERWWNSPNICSMYTWKSNHNWLEPRLQYLLQWPTQDTNRDRWIIEQQHFIHREVTRGQYEELRFAILYTILSWPIICGEHHYLDTYYGTLRELRSPWETSSRQYNRYEL